MDISTFIEDHMMEIFAVFTLLAVSGGFGLLFLWRFLSILDCDLTTYVASRWGHLFAGTISDRLSGKVVWISGACSGIGEQLAYDLAKIGCRLVLSGHLDTLTSIRNKCLEESDGKLKENDILALRPFDIRDCSLHEEMVTRVVQHFSRIDILVNNVGRSQRAKFTEIPVNEDRELFDINVFGQISLSRTVMKVFEEQGSGHFVITSSVAGKFGAPFSASYTASKHALQGYFETVRCEGFTKGIVVTTICPGPTLTPLIERSFHSESFKEEVAMSSNLKDGKLSVTRCTELMTVAIAYRLQESWISLPPILWFCFTCQYYPDLSKFIMVRFLPPDRLYKMRKGDSSTGDKTDKNRNVMTDGGESVKAK